MKNLEEFRDELREHLYHLEEMTIDAIGVECELELMRRKGQIESIHYVLGELRTVLKYHECSEHRAVRDGAEICMICGWDFCE